jgi:[glutamine synthetase] adenylyltransferase / [glutamine synthetase]-adenylyl-L-tyrosine phosphorylase
MGKLGARELNVSSDIDLIYVYEDDGQTTGPVAVSAHEYFSYVAKRLYALIGETTDDGFVFRVDLALRPNGNSGPPVVSLGMLEEYFQVQGREWERFAWLKSRVVAPRAAVTSGRALRAALAGHALRLPPLPGLRCLRGPAPAAPQDPRRGAAPRRRPARARQRRQALARRHPRDRVHRAADAGGARRPVPRDPHAQHAEGAGQAAGRARADVGRDTAAAGRGLRVPAPVEHRIQYLDDQQTHLLPDRRRRPGVDRRAAWAGLPARRCCELLDRLCEVREFWSPPSSTRCCTTAGPGQERGNCRAAAAAAAAGGQRGAARGLPAALAERCAPGCSSRACWRCATTAACGWAG